MDNAQQKTALIVDDEPEIVELVAAEFEERGWRVVLAANGREAMDKLSQEHANLIVSDLMMPRMNGLELLEYVRAHDPKGPAFILVSGSIQLTKERKLNPDGQFAKPLSLSELVNKGEELIARR